jgi:tetratricopeptide (TPR) repeat protein
MVNKFPKWLYDRKLIFSIIHIIGLLFLYGCQESIKEKSQVPTTFSAISAQTQYDSKTSIEKWDYILNIVSSSFDNQDKVDEWLVKNSTNLFSTTQQVPLKRLKSINFELYNAEVTKPAFLFAEFTLNNIENQNDPSIFGYPAATLSNYYQDLKLFDSVIKYNLILKKALPYIDSSRLKLIYYTNNANSLKEQGDLFESAVNYHKALDLIQKNDSLTTFTLITNLSSIYYELNYPDKAKFFIDSARSMISFNDWTAVALNHAGLVYSKTSDFKMAKKSFLIAIKKSIEEKNQISLAQSYSNYANFNRKIKNFPTAFEYMKKSDAICQELGLDFGVLINRINRSELYYDLSNFELAAEELKAVSKDLPNFSSPKIEIDFYKLSYRINDAIGNENLANSMYRKYVEKEKAFFGDIPRSILAEWELATENEKITKDRLAFNLLEEKQSKEKYIIVLIATILVLVSITILFARNRKFVIEREKEKQDKQRIEFDLELKSKQLVSESLKNLTIQNTKEELLHQLDDIIHAIPKIHHGKFDSLKRTLKFYKSSSILDEFETRFTGVYEAYYGKLKNLAPELTPNELRICALMRLNISTKEMALLTNRTIGTVDNTRSSIRKKLKLEEEINLQDFLLSI